MTTRERSSRPSASQVVAAVDSKGIYTIPAAARLLSEEPATIRRWALGYRRRGQQYAPALVTDVPAVAGARVVTFLELVELMFIQALLKTGLSWSKVREASRAAASLLRQESHPFATKRWFVDPAALYLQLGHEHGEEILIEVAGHGQVAMQPVLRPYLTQIEFGAGGVAQRWYPRGFAVPVVIDPRRAFGMPVTTKSGVRTEALAGLHRAGESIQSIAAWYRIEETEVAAAVEFEQALSIAA